MDLEEDKDRLGLVNRIKTHRVASRLQGRRTSPAVAERRAEAVLQQHIGVGNNQQQQLMTLRMTWQYA